MSKLPHSIEAEMGVIGSVIFEPATIELVSLQSDDFYDHRHQKLWKHLTDIHLSGKPMDAISVYSYLDTRGELQKVGGADYLLDLQNPDVCIDSITHYSDAVKLAKKCRLEIAALEDGLRVAYSGASASEVTMSALIDTSIKEDKNEDLGELADQFIEDCRTGNVGHFNWWCEQWTDKLGKMSSDLMILHAPRSTGKTALMLQWIMQSHKGGQRTPLASIEMLKKELMPRFIANIGQVSTYLMRVRGHITLDEDRKSTAAVKEIRILDLCIRDKKMTIDDIRSWATAEARRGVDAIFIDNLLSISDGGKQYQSKTIMYDDFIRKFRDLRDQLKVPIIILAHPNQEGGVAWSKDVENFADIILYMAEVPPEGVNIRGVQVSQIPCQGKHVLAMFQKNRQGISPVASLDFIGDTQTFKHLEWVNV